jgi:cytochrome c5
MRFARVVGTVLLLSGPLGVAAASAVADRESVSSYDLALGEAVFTSTCRSCHGQGVKDAPNPDNAAEWEERIQQDLDTLIRHAIDGHGRMPAKGGYSELLDTEVAAAVAYVFDKSHSILETRKKARGKTRCHPINNPDACSDKDMEDVMTLHMLWLLVGPRE